MANLSERLSANFTLGELLRSNTAERFPRLKEQQLNPPPDVLKSLRYVVTTVLQPIRDQLSYPMRITSGYRSPSINKKVGGSSTSQHVKGEAADCQLSANFLSDRAAAAARNLVRKKVKEITGKPIRSDANANFYMFAFICLHLENLDIDQVIHEYGEGFGQPSWIHIAASKRQDKRQILCVGSYTGKKYLKPTLAEALAYGT